MTSKKKHQKHTDLNTPSLGEFHRNELAVIGAPCSVIRDFTLKLSSHLDQRFSTVYIDADHSSDDDESQNAPDFQGILTDKISHHRLDFRSTPNIHQRRRLLNEFDLALINGNHFKGAAQIVFVHQAKKESLSRKLDRLDNIVLVVMMDDNDDIYDFLFDVMPPRTPIIPLENMDGINEWLDKWMASHIAGLFGLVLSGGKSTRLGKDKTVLDYHGQPQYKHVAALMKKYCPQIRISIRDDQDWTDNSKAYSGQKDEFTGLGPFGGILTAFRNYPNNAWLAMATDLPLANEEAIKFLVKNRNPAKVATAFHNPVTGFPDPLLTIWEPKAYPVMLEFLAQGYSCPRKVLINSDIETLEAPNPDWLTNVNTPEDLEKVRNMLASEV